MSDVKRWTLRESLLSPEGKPIANPEVTLASDYDDLVSVCHEAIALIDQLSERIDTLEAECGRLRGQVAEETGP